MIFVIVNHGDHTIGDEMKFDWMSRTAGESPEKMHWERIEWNHLIEMDRPSPGKDLPDSI